MKKLFCLLAITLFLFSCNTLKEGAVGTITGIKKDFSVLGATSDNKPDNPTGKEPASNTPELQNPETIPQMQTKEIEKIQSANEQSLENLKTLFMQQGLEARIAVLQTESVFQKTQNQEAWNLLVTNYFAGRNKEALDWITYRPSKEFAMAILSSKSFTEKEIRLVVVTTCDPDVGYLYKTKYHPGKQIEKEIRKSCPNF